MKIPTVRKFTRKGTTGPYSAYNDPKQSLEDMILLLRHNNFPTSVSGVEEYVALLKEDGFFKDDEKNYLNGMKRFL